MDGLLAQLAIIVALTLANGFFAGSEIALLAVRKTRLQELAEQGRKAARTALQLRATPETFLATVQIGITVVSASAAVFGGAKLEEPAAAFFRRIGAGEAADELALVAVVVLVSTLSIVVGELVPKSLALHASERFALIAARPISALARLARPFVWLLTAMANAILKPFGDTTRFSETRLSPDELQQLLHDASLAGSIDHAAAEAAARAVDLGELKINAIMVPRPAVVALRASWPTERILELLKRAPHARYPLMREDSEDVVGYVLAREIYESLLERGELDLGRLVREIPYLPEQMPVLGAMRVLQRSRTELGAVVDEIGTMIGVVTFEDVAEELIGEVIPEHERPKERVRREGDGVYLVDGSVSILDASRATGLDLPQDPAWTTVAGLIIARAGRIPAIGERLRVETDVEAEVVEASRRRVALVRLRELPSEPAAEDEG